jgi:ATP-dependent RNA helicase RhlE
VDRSCFGHGWRCTIVPRRKIKTVTSFSDLGLSSSLLKALTIENYGAPTPIQARAIPDLLAGRDLLGIAQTGTGKTAAFALPILDRLGSRPQLQAGPCRALILSPTRELCAQIGLAMRNYGRFSGLRVATVYGGVSIGQQIRAVQQGVDIVVATPGRLMDLLDRRALSLAKISIFVLDEADRMLDLGFIHAIRTITRHLPKNRQSMFFSATMPQEIASLAAELLNRPVRIEVTPAASTVERVDQQVIHLAVVDKLPMLTQLLAKGGMTRSLVFTRTKRGADKLMRGLTAAAIDVAVIHGNKSQGQRERALDKFRNGKASVLVATDIAARGIDIDGVSHVVNYDLPEVPEAYVHRIGRTARAGAAGIAISFCDPEQRPLLRAIERLTRTKIRAVEHRLAASSGTPVDIAKTPRQPPAGNYRRHRRKDHRSKLRGGRGQKATRHQTAIQIGNSG